MEQNKGNFQDEDQLVQVSKLYKVIGEPTRLKILTLLIEKEHNVGMICDQLKLEQSAVSHQLRVLRENHIVSARREGVSMFYSLDDEHVKDILLKTFDHVAHTTE